MGRYISLLAVLVIFCGSHPTFAAKKYDLTTVPRFAVGDSLTRIYSQTYQSTLLDKEGETIQDSVTAIDATSRQEVRSVAEGGRVGEFSEQIVTAIMSHTFKEIGEDAEKTTIELADIETLARRCGSNFRADTTTITSGSVATLSASRLYLLKRFFNDRMTFGPYPETNALLLPRTPVSVADTWTIDTDDLKRWIRNTPGVRKVKIEIKYKFKMNDAPAAAKLNVSARIDVASGRWLSKSIKGQITAGTDELKLRMLATTVETIIYHPSSGERPASRPAKRYNLAWRKAPTDTNSYRNTESGVSLDVPKTYRPKELGADSNIVAGFVAEENRSISITVSDAKRPMDMDELALIMIGNLKRSIRGFTIREQEKFLLPDNVPAMLIVADGYDKTAALVILFAIDGMRLLNVMAAVPAEQKDYLTEMKRIVRTFRTFEPDLATGK
ncbi:MAG: hypothetical protein ACYSTL_08735 [Planctomycetota bacterium]|jgi:hypothetical protein